MGCQSLPPGTTQILGRLGPIDGAQKTKPPGNPNVSTSPARCGPFQLRITLISRYVAVLSPEGDKSAAEPRSAARITSSLFSGRLSKSGTSDFGSITER